VKNGHVAVCLFVGAALGFFVRDVVFSVEVDELKSEAIDRGFACFGRRAAGERLRFLWIDEVSDEWFRAQMRLVQERAGAR
jgi:hypothetical protein